MSQVQLRSARWRDAVTVNRAGLFVVGALVLVTLCCLNLRPLWVDEIYQLEATRDLSFQEVLQSSMKAPGGMPLAYLLQKFWLSIWGFSTVVARAPAAFFGLGSVAATAWVAKMLRIDPLPVAILSLITPLLLRYSTEARPYSQGLFFSVLATGIFLTWSARPSAGKWLAYVVCVTAGLYSQPFGLFVAGSHVAYLLFTNRSQAVRLLAAVAAAVLLYTPWFLASREALRHEVWPHLMFFSWRQVSVSMIIREISGGGYVCSVSMLILAAFATGMVKRELLWIWIAMPLALAITADALFNYFFAIRQLIFVLPPLLLLAASGLSSLGRSRPVVALLLAAIYVTGAAVKDIRWQRDKRENWGLAAAAIRRRLQQTGGCVKFVPGRDAPSYYFFEPELKKETCGTGDAGVRSALVAVSPYAEASDRKTFSAGENIGNTLIVMRDHF